MFDEVDMIEVRLSSHHVVETQFALLMPSGLHTPAHPCSINPLLEHASISQEMVKRELILLCSLFLTPMLFSVNTVPRKSEKLVEERAYAGTPNKW